MVIEMISFFGMIGHYMYFVVGLFGLAVCVIWLTLTDSVSMVNYYVSGFVRACGLSYL